jgi:SAM-dependent methyltransferase
MHRARIALETGATIFLDVLFKGQSLFYRLRGLRIYFFALGTAVRLLAAGRTTIGLKLLIASVGYWRLLPNAVVWEEAAAIPHPRILDVSSPKLVSLYLAARTGGDVLATDLNDREIFNRWLKMAEIRGLSNYRVEYQDARQLALPDSTFDVVYSLSVIEHIPGNGDREALQEFARVTKPGGVIVVEVPYRRKFEEVFRKTDSKGAALEREEFFERRYDAAALEQKLLQVVGLRLERKMILGEWLAIDPVINGDRLPRLLRIAALPWEPWLAAVNYWMRPDDSAGHPLAALMVYRKVA